ncbi:MAG: hypothetical protein ACYC8T_31020 [Myxococcaceae bacterium]
MDVHTWIERQRKSHRRLDLEEAERFRKLGPEERSRLVATLCRSGMEILLSLPDERRTKALEFREPLPESSVRLLARLRELYAGRHAHS